VTDHPTGPHRTASKTTKTPRQRGFRKVRQRGLEPPPGYPGPGPQPGNSGVISVQCVQIVQNVRVSGRNGRNGRSGCCCECCHERVPPRLLASADWMTVPGVNVIVAGAFMARRPDQRRLLRPLRVQRVAGLLRDAAAESRITLEELSERLEFAWARGPRRLTPGRGRRQADLTTRSRGRGGHDGNQLETTRPRTATARATIELLLRVRAPAQVSQPRTPAARD
jgi:hypothetical protein